MPANAEQRTLAALAIVTDVVHRPNGVEDFDDTELARVVLDGELTDQDLVLGLITLAMILLVKLESAGQPIDAVLADIGLRYRRAE
jgi:hypothetical protein